MLFGDMAIGSIEEGSGFGYQVIGQELQGLMRFGSLVVGSREEAVGSGFQDIGNIVNKKLQVSGFNLKLAT
jgi:hypothetical protein